MRLPALAGPPTTSLDGDAFRKGSFATTCPWCDPLILIR